MRVLLVNPPVLGFNENNVIRHPTLAFGYLAPILIAQNHEVRVLDLLIPGEGMQELQEKLAEYKPDFVGIHSHTQTYFHAIKIADRVKKWNNGCFVALGGPHATLDPVPTIERQHSFDFVFRHDAEKSLITVLNLLQENGDKKLIHAGLSRINGICFRGTEGNAILTPLDEPVKCFTDMPKCDRAVFNMPWYLKNDSETVLITARGCPGECSFCATRVIGRCYRVHSLEKIMEELGDIAGYGFESFFIGDDTFACSTNRTIEFCEEYIRRGFKMRWTSNLRVVDAKPERLKQMRAAGAYRVFMGLESFNSHTQDVYNKKLNYENTLTALKNVHDAGLEIHGSFIVGGPDDTRESLLRMIPLIKELGLTVVTFNKIFAWPGTPYGDKPAKFGLYYTEDRFWYERDAWIKRHPFYTKKLSPEDISEVCRELYFEFLS